MLTTLMSLGGAALLGIIGWIFQLGNRVTVLEQKHASFVDKIEDKLDDIIDRLGRIEDKF